MGDAERLRSELRRLGCSDGYCVVAGKARGMHTNGGCRCLGRAGVIERQRVAAALALLRKAAGLE